MSKKHATTRDCLRRIVNGDATAVDTLMPLVYDELRTIATSYLRRERPDHSLQPTALVHEAFVRLAGHAGDIQGRSHLLALCAQAMRRILVDHARNRQALKRGGGGFRRELTEDLVLAMDRDDDVLALDEALLKLATLDEKQARIVEMRFFGGLTEVEIADALGVSDRTVRREWTMIRAWLRSELEVAT